VVVAQRLAADHHRKVYGRPKPGTDLEATEIRRRLVDLVDEAVDLKSIEGSIGPTPADAVVHHERRAIVASVLDQLEPRDRMMLALRFEDDASARRIAEAMGFKSPFHVYRRLKKVLSALRKELVERGIHGVD
jgi:RNA polymerase sigma factor (sigma-70 family)